MPDLNQLMDSLRKTAQKKNAPPDFKTASAFRMPFGKYSGLTLDEIGASDTGLKYLDWLRGEVKAGDVLDMVSAYLDDPTIADALENLLDEDD